MKILALDTALSGCAVALLDSESGAAVSESVPMARGQAEWLIPMLLDVLERAEASFDSVGRIGVTVGPGAFTGLRIGLAAAAGLAVALDCPVVGVSTLEALAAGFFRTRSLAPRQTLGILLETKRADYYVQFFEADGAPLTPPAALDGEALAAEAAALGGVLWIGDAVERYTAEGGEGQTESGFARPDPVIVAALALERPVETARRVPAPLYLRGADVSQSRKKQRRILASP